MGGLVSPTLDLNAQRVVVNVTASSMRLSANTVRYVNGIATAENRRLASGVSLFSTTYSVVAVTEVNVPLTTATSSDPAAYYASLTALLTEAVVSGQFTEDMARVALLFNATVLESAQATAVSNGNVQVVDPSSSSSTDDEPLDDGGISGVVIGGFIFLILVAAAAKHFLFANTSFRIADVSLIAVRSSSSSGNGTQMVSVVPR